MNMKKTIIIAFCLLAIICFTSFSKNSNISYRIEAEPVTIDTQTPFPITGKVTVYGYRSRQKIALGTISYTAAIEIKETDRETYSVVTVKLINQCNYDVSGYVYGICNGQQRNFSNFEIVANNSWNESKIMSDRVENIKISVSLISLGII